MDEQNEFLALDKEQLVKVLKDIIRADKTPRYEYEPTDRNRNAEGDLPKSGRWNTPSEIARATARNLGIYI